MDGGAAPDPRAEVAVSRPCVGPPSLLRVEVQRSGVDAVPQARGLRPVREDVAEMATAGGALHLGSDHAERPIGLGHDRRGIDGSREARPARARVELGLGIEELGTAAGTAVRTGSVLVPVGASEGSLGALVAEDLVLDRRKGGTPLLLGLVDAGRRLRVGHGRAGYRPRITAR